MRILGFPPFTRKRNQERYNTYMHGDNIDDITAQLSCINFEDEKLDLVDEDDDETLSDEEKNIPDGVIEDFETVEPLSKVDLVRFESAIESICKQILDSE
ncbi:unnamed protein product [Brachionus calyciflorus]|uniref:Uncharacterized protein n=1 Tax=Brachionus calyciflorus TaxID=104777 RepID=A0A814IRA6_9BILA|nr:unnamed protein product [Brachionus calyciflorus]